MNGIVWRGLRGRGNSARFVINLPGRMLYQCTIVRDSKGTMQKSCQVYGTVKNFKF